MSIFNPFAIGFACVAASFAVGVDYVVQSKVAGSNPGVYAFSSYVGNLRPRVEATIASVDKTRRQAVEARTHLPMDPAGWERVDWDIGAIDMDALTAGMGIVKSMSAKDERTKAIALANYEAWEYRQGDQVVRISASFDTDPEPSETAIAGQLTGTFFPVDRPKYSPFKSVGNVPFLAVTDARNPDEVTQTLLEARLGDEILIAVAADAETQAVMGLLAQIDFHSLNLMLTDPLPYLGEDARPLSAAQNLTLAGLQARALNNRQPVPEGMVEAILAGEYVEEPEAVAALEPSQPEAQPEPEKPVASRLQLSGGRVCLSSDTRLCD
ncbi:MAG: hypothetical protein AAFY25_06720 [Pseudomonadota bacterium]